MNKRVLQSYAPVVVRVGLAIVFLIFGIDQFIHPAIWASYFPSFLPANTVFFNGVFDLILGLWLLSGVYVRVSGALASLHLLGVFFVLTWMSKGYNEIAVRDFGLFCAAFSVFLSGKDPWCSEKFQV